MHGGTSPGAPKGNQNAAKHGIWGRLVGDDLIDEALALAELAPEERARMHRLIREARVLRAAAKADTPLQALDRGWASILSDLDPDAAEVGGDAEAQGIVVLDGDSEDWLDG